MAKNVGQGSMARKVVKAIRRMRLSKVVDLLAHEAGRKNAEALQETIASSDRLAKLGVAHGVYVYAQNVVSVLVEELTTLPKLSRIADVIEAAHEEYMPSGPPWSPLTMSYFTCWCFFDLAFGLRKETLGTIILEVGRELEMNAGLLQTIKLMQGSRMGVYVNEGTDDADRVVLRELALGSSSAYFVPVSYRGSPGEMWLARVLPSAGPGLDAVVFTTPYVITRPGEQEWTAYFDRTLGGAKDRLSAYEALMKYGPERHYWNEYIFESYCGHIQEAIFLAGLPDVASTRPHSRHYVPPGPAGPA